jgi:hypothetical protein
MSHALDTKGGEFLFRFVYLEDGKNSAQRFNKGDTAALTTNKNDNKPPLSRVTADGVLRDSQGRKVAPIGPLYPWSATITAIHGDGTVDLLVKHPRGDHEFGVCGVKIDPEGAMRTCKPV